MLGTTPLQASGVLAWLLWAAAREAFRLSQPRGLAPSIDWGSLPALPHDNEAHKL